MFNFISSLIPGNDLISRVINGASIAVLGALGIASVATINPLGLLVIGYVAYSGATGTELWAWKL